MNITTPPIAATGQTLAVTKLTATLPRLQVGDQLQATVLFSRGGKTELQLPQGTLSARTELPLRGGEQLKLTVAQLQPQVTLTISKPATTPADALGQKIYPKQLPLPQALQNLGQIMQSQTTGGGGQIAIQQILQQLPTITQLFNPQAIKEQIGKSGTFMENNLLHNRATSLKGDLKMQLLQLKAKLFNQPGQQKALQQIESMIARIELNQLKSAQSQAQGTPSSQQDKGSREATQRSWQVEIPFMVDDKPQQAALKFRQQQEEETEEQSRWHIEIQLNPPELGEMEIHAIHHNEQLDIHFLTEKEETSALITAQIETLESSLSVAGLQPGTLFSRQKNIHDVPPEAISTTTGFSIKA